eukprot:m.220484 g.220484  ORF g.220484 m.220484 type:complete len:381 (+) comp19167_c0_seq1:444-1586(+)
MSSRRKAKDVSPEKEARRKSKLIDAEIKKNKSKVLRQIKFLLLGSGESGKSTVLKQMKIIHGDGFSLAERKDFVGIIHANIITAMKVLYHGLARFGGGGDRQSSASASSSADDFDEGISTCSGGMLMDEDLSQQARAFFENLNATVTLAPIPLFQRLWADPAIQAVFAKRNHFHFSDGAVYFMDSLARIADPAYVPSDEDIVRARVPTVGVHEYSFMLDNIDFLFVDVGGQKAERRKWLSCFDDVTCLIYIVATSDFDQTATESESGGNRLREAHKLFSHIVRGKVLARKPVMLFLNKTDLLKQKLELGCKIQRHFPDFVGEEGNLESVQQWMLRKFARETKAVVYPHFTTAVNRNNIEFVFVSVRQSIRSILLASFNIS